MISFQQPIEQSAAASSSAGQATTDISHLVRRKVSCWFWNIIDFI